MVTVLFLYRDGESLLRQLRQVLRRVVGVRIEGYLGAVGKCLELIARMARRRGLDIQNVDL